MQSVSVVIPDCQSQRQKQGTHHTQPNSETQHSPHTARLQGLGDLESLVDVVGDDPGSQAVPGPVGPVDDLLHVAELDDALDWPKDLVTCIQIYQLMMLETKRK